MYRETSFDVEVVVNPIYVEAQSDPRRNYYFFAYQVRITNNGHEAKQLISRRWVITDGNGRVEKVEGPGVVGEQPRLAPGETFEYTSACPLTTPTGNMRGTYQMVDDAGRKFEVTIPVFFLRHPSTFN